MAADIGASSLNLTPEEKRIYSRLFKQADTEGVNVVTGDVAVKFFERTQLDPGTLGAIWQIADTENRGFLTPAGFSIVLRLIGHCQAGRDPSVSLAAQPGPLPKFEGLNITSGPQVASALQVQNSGGPIRVPPLAQDKIKEYSALFDRAGGQNGNLPGDAAANVFQRSGLPNEILGKIWALVDTEERGEFNRTQFTVAMHLLMSLRTNAMKAVPANLPPALFEAAARRASPQPAASIPRQFSGQSPQRVPMSPSRQGFGVQPLSTDVTGNNWVISPQQKASYDASFATLDRSGTGFISGEQAVGFFSKSGLSEDVLAAIWDLAESSSEGKLNRDEFAVAMYLIWQQRRDPQRPIPTSLPPDLVPPSARRQVRPAPQQTPQGTGADPFAQAPPKPKSAIDDLFGLDAISENEISSQPLQPTKRAVEDPFSAGGSTSSPAQSQPTAAFQSANSTGNQFKPFIPTSSFGQGLAAQETGGSFPAASSIQPQAQKAQDDLLGDGDPEINRKLDQDTTELANMSNQVTTLRTQMQEAQNKKMTTEQEVSVAKTQRAELESRLAQFRTQYEQEVREVKSLEEQLQTVRAETQALQKEFAMTQGSHDDLRTQHERMTAALATDQQENNTLKEKLRALNAEVAELKPQLEKLKSDTRQQKGLVAINKKQLATTEAERDRLQSDMQAESKALADANAEHAAQIEQQKARVVSPSASVASGHSTNPFFRQPGVSSPSQVTSPPASAINFDDFFGGAAASQPEADKSLATPLQSPQLSKTTEFHDQAEEGASGVATPTVSPLPTPQSELSTAEQPPPPPQSRQITSNALPLSNIMRSDSFSSSVRANPPASRSGFSGFATPTQTNDSASASVNGEQESPSLSKVQTSIPTTSSSAVDPPTVTETAAAPSTATGITPTVSIPGAFPGEPSYPSASGSGGFTNEGSPSFETAASSIQHTPVAASGSTPFDEAPTTSENPKSKMEFPPIQDLEDDEDDSDSEIEGRATSHSRGFSDAFAPAEPGSSKEASDAPQTGPIEDSGELPDLSAQASPPSYSQTVTGPTDEHRESNQFPPEFGGLLPSREISNSPPVESKNRETSMFPSFETATNGAGAPGSSIAAIADNTAAAKPKDDFEDDFEDLAEAKPESRDEFDSAFDDLTDAKEADNAALEAFGSSKDETDFDAFGAPGGPTKATTFSTQTTPPAVIGHSSKPSDDFPGFQGASGAGEAKASGQGDQHDWDAIFSGLDNPPDLGSSNGNGSGLSPFDTVATQTTRPAPPPRAPSEHDDPIVKQVTALGFSRDAAVKALEKYDYNLEQAVDYLTSK